MVIKKGDGKLAIDKISIYITNVSSIKEKLFQERYRDNWIYHENEENRCLSFYYKAVEGIFMKYMPMHKDDSLYIEFNIAKLLQGDNIASIFSCNIQQLHNIIRDKLKGTIDLNVAPNIRYWKVSYYENNINIIRDIGSIKALYNLIAKLENINKLKKDIVEHEGTIYFFNGKSRESSDLEIRVYLKLRQIIHTRPRAIIKDYYDSELIQLKPGEDILRIEVALKRDYIFKLFKPAILKCTSNDSITEIKEVLSSKPIATLEEVFEFNNQINILNKVLKMFHLDKFMTTKNNLFRFIDSRVDLSKTQKKTMKNALNHINNVSHKTKLSIVTIYKCRAWVLSEGYHYNYADIEIEPIIIKDIVNKLPQKQQGFIKLYNNSNIYYDVWSSRIPSRIY